MMRDYIIIPLLLAPAFMIGCAVRDSKPVETVGTLAELHDVLPDIQDVQVGQELEQAMHHYRQFLEDTPETTMTPEAMRRLADLQLEKQFGIRTSGDRLREMAVPQNIQMITDVNSKDSAPYASLTGESPRESDQEFERRTTEELRILQSDDDGISRAGLIDDGEASTGPLEAIAIYSRLLSEYPGYKDSDQVLYQMARAYDELGRTDEAMEAMERLIHTNPHSEHMDEVQFRRGEYFFTRRKYREAESAYSAIINLGAGSSYYELALYKLGWSFYKQELYEDALHRYMELFDYKVSLGYDFNQAFDEEADRRVADTLRVISLSFNNLGGSDAVREYFSVFGNRPYEDRIYGNLGEHYLAKLRYDDAAKAYRTFIAIYPFHRAAPHFGVNVIDTFTRGGFSMLVLESKREFASRYGLQAEYWQHFNPEDLPDVLVSLKVNLKDLATHYHAEYQRANQVDEKLGNYNQALRWYGDYLESFPADADSPAINYDLAGLLLEDRNYGEAARQFERTAYDYPPHSQSADAGYAAVYAYRNHMETIGSEELVTVKQFAVASSIKFADTFPDHEQAATVLGKAADDMYEMMEYRLAVDSARRVIDAYPDAEATIRRSAWIVVAHGSFELGEYGESEHAYARILAVTPEGDENRTAFVDNLAASIYKQGEYANEAQDYRAAADHFLRIRSAAPASSFRASAEYDAGAALIKLQSWTEAVAVFDTFRNDFPGHQLQVDATRQIAHAHRESGQLLLAAEEFERLAEQSNDPELRSDALLVAGDFYEQSDARHRALAVYNLFVSEFPEPVESALETRDKIAELYRKGNEESLYQRELEHIIRIDADAGQGRTSRTRTIAARAALILAEQRYREFVVVQLHQPFDVSLKEKQHRMDDTIEAMSQLVEYQIADVTAAATYYMAETYLDFSRSLVKSERPADLEPGELELYEMDLDEAAFPFEEKAIDVHEKNMEMLHAGVSSEWIERSLDRLTDLMPGRYAKAEMSSGFLYAIDRYVYRSPMAQAFLQSLNDDDRIPDEPARTTHKTVIAADEGGIGHANRQ
jgi:cellulose synthase operon protein C